MASVVWGSPDTDVQIFNKLIQHARCDTFPIMTPTDTSVPRIALFISDPALLRETEEILQKQYSSLMLITEKDKLKEFAVPLVIVVDRIKDVDDIRKLHPVEGTRVLVILHEKDSEQMSAAFKVGADDCISHPFAENALIEKTEKYLSWARKG